MLPFLYLPESSADAPCTVSSVVSVSCSFYIVTFGSVWLQNSQATANLRAQARENPGHSRVNGWAGFLWGIWSNHLWPQEQGHVPGYVRLSFLVALRRIGFLKWATGGISNDSHKDYSSPIWDWYLSMGSQYIVLPFHSSQHTVLTVNISGFHTGLGASHEVGPFLFFFLYPMFLVQSLVYSK